MFISISEKAFSFSFYLIVFLPLFDEFKTSEAKNFNIIL